MTAQAAVNAPELAPRAGRHDHALRRKTIRRGKEKGCWLYIVAEDLQTAGIDPSGPAPFYRVWPGKRRGLTIRLYLER